jgi:DNA mismatch repair protein MutS2
MNGWDQALAKLEFEKVRQRVLRYASSDPGRERLATLGVLASGREIRDELATVSEVKRLIEQVEPLPLDGIHPISEAVAKAAVDGMVLSSRELLHVGLTLRASRLVRAFVFSRRDVFPRIGELAESLATDKVLEFNIEQAIDEAGNVRASASRELLSIRRTIADRYDDLRKRLGSILRTVAELGFSQEEIITTREGRMVIPVKSEHKNRVPGFVHSASSSGATVFIEPTETLELNNEIRSLQFQEQREVERILKSLTAQVGERKAGLQANLRILGMLDAFQAKAKYSIEILGTEPRITNEGPIVLRGGRHPLLLLAHGYGATVPLDLEVGGEFTTLLISGPNAGGKSVAMKCVGLLVLMAHAGMHIPAADGTVIPLFDSCHVDIGDEQSIENDLSTFSSHLANLKRITEQAGARSLVLIDEIGSGTDPAEGGAIAAAILEELTVRKAVTVATTHQGALKVFAHETPGVANGAMEFDIAGLTPTYRFRAGIPGSSYALEMASRLGFSRGLMDRSRQLLGEQHTKIDRLITELESAAQEARKELADAREEKVRLDGLVARYEASITRLSAEIRDQKRRALEEAATIVERANALIENSIREIRESAAGKETVREVREKVESARKEIASGVAETAPPETREAETIMPGSTVTVGEGSDVGEVASVATDGKSVVVVFGAVKMRVAMKDVRLARKRVPASYGSAGSNSAEKPAEVRRELDIRGLTGEEALPLVDKFIDDAVLSGLHRIDVIHGKGTGALRKKVMEFLGGHPRVKAHRMGEWNEGGAGATVIELTED